MVSALKQFIQTPNAGDMASALVVAHFTGEKVEVIGEEEKRRSNLLAIGSIFIGPTRSGFILTARLMCRARTVYD